LNKIAASKSQRSDAFYKDARVVSCAHVIVKNGSVRAIPFSTKVASIERHNSPGRDFSCYGISSLVGGGQIHNKNLVVERKVSLAQ